MHLFVLASISSVNAITTQHLGRIESIISFFDSYFIRIFI